MSDPEDGEVVSKPQSKPKEVFRTSNYRTKVCEHFKKGACKNGDKCSFQHPKEMQNVVRICKYYLGGACQNQACSFSHDLSKYQCKFYFIGANCKEQNCRFSHDFWENEMQKQIWVNDNDQFIKDYYARRGTTGLGDFYDDMYKKKFIEKNQLDLTIYPKHMLPPNLQQQHNNQFPLYQPYQLNQLFQIIQPPQNQHDFANYKHLQQVQFQRLNIPYQEQKNQGHQQSLPNNVEPISSDDDSVKEISDIKSSRQSSQSKLIQQPQTIQQTQPTTLSQPTAVQSTQPIQQTQSVQPSQSTQPPIEEPQEEVVIQPPRKRYRRTNTHKRKNNDIAQSLGLPFPIRQNIIKYFMGI